MQWTMVSIHCYIYLVSRVCIHSVCVSRQYRTFHDIPWAWGRTNPRLPIKLTVTYSMEEGWRGKLNDPLYHLTKGHN
jgi:hypothetical protein